MSIDVNVQNDLVIVTETTEDIVVNVSNAAGPAGPAGPAGANGVGVPVGGTTGQVLKKFTNTNYDTYWAADASGLTSVGLSVPTGLTVTNSPLTTNGTIAVGLASGYSIPTTASQATWNTAYNDSIVSAGVTGTSTKTLTLNQQDGGTVTASWSDIDTGLTSVGLSMPSAFAVSNSPLTSNGTIAVTGAGTSAQYVRGDGQLANFPTSEGGGSSVNYYLNGSVSQGTFGGDTYYEMSKTPVLGAGTNFTRTNGQGNGYIASFITDAGDPSLLNIPGGNWNLEFYFQSSASGGSPQFYGEVYKVSSANVFTLVASGSTNPEGITNGTTIDQYFTSIPVPQTSLLATDRLAIRIFVTPSGRTITLHTEDNNLCEVLTTFSTGLNALNGLTAQVQYFATGTNGTDFAISSSTDTHTFNLPTASGTNRGALSSADWSTFSGKVGGSGVAGQVSYWDGTNSQTGSNNLFWDAANSRLGIGTNAPQTTFHIQGGIGSFRVLSSGAEVYLTRDGNNDFLANGGTSAELSIGANNTLKFLTGSTLTERARFFSGGNFALSGTTDGGQRLQVYGDAFVKGSGATSATFALLVQNSSGSRLFDINNSGYYKLSGGYGLFFSQFTTSQGAASINGSNTQFYNYTTTEAATFGAFSFHGDNFSQTSGSVHTLYVSKGFYPTSGTATHSTLSIAPPINQTGGANGITRGILVNPSLTAAADWRSIEWSNNSGWGLYGAGTANNYLGGSLGIASNNVNSGFKLGINGDIIVSGATPFIAFNTATSSGSTPAYIQFINSTTIFNIVSTGAIDFFSNANQRMRLTSAGRLLLGLTAESTFLLDVNGTARVSGASTFNNSVTNTSGGFVHSSSSTTNDAFYTLLSSQIRFYVNANGYCKSTSNIVSDANGATTLNASAIAQIDSITKGFLPPRMTTTEKNAIASPATGLQVYDTTLGSLNVYNGSSWVALGAGGGGSVDELQVSLICQVFG